MQNCQHDARQVCHTCKSNHICPLRIARQICHTANQRSLEPTREEARSNGHVSAANGAAMWTIKIKNVYAVGLHADRVFLSIAPMTQRNIPRTAHTF